jgi:hypothetical protein
MQMFCSVYDWSIYISKERFDGRLYWLIKDKKGILLECLKSLSQKEGSDGKLLFAAVLWESNKRK